MDRLKDLTQQFKPLVNKLSVLKFHRFLFALAGDWAIVFGGVALSENFHSWTFYLLACVVIASRQHALMVLCHEAAHYRVSKHRAISDFIGDVFTAYPVFIDTQIYRSTHFAHHQYLNSEKDPDWIRKIPHREWQFPKARRQLAFFFLKYALLEGPREWVRAAIYFSGVQTTQLRNREFGWRLARKIIFWAALLSAGLAFGQTHLLFYYWLVPFFFIFPSMQRLRSIAEHFALENQHELNQTRDIQTNALEAFLLAPHNVGFHLTHHLFSSIPFYNLPALHEALRDNSTFVADAHLNTTYIWPSERSLLNDLTNAEPTKPSAATRAA